MASRSTHNVKSMGRALVKLAGSFAPNGTSALVAASTKGKGFTVARSGVGLFTITLAEKYADLVCASGNVQLATAADMAVQFGAYSASAKTLVLRTMVAATATDIAANADNRVHFELTLRNSSLA